MNSSGSSRFTHHNGKARAVPRSLPAHLLSPLALLLLAITLLATLAPTAHAAGAPGLSAAKARVIEHWTPQRRAEAIPRDLRIDTHGQGYLRRPDGSLIPYDRLVAGNGATPAKGKPSGGGGGGGKGGGGSDTTAPTIDNMDPTAGATIGSAYAFSATITDASGIKSVTFVIQYPNGSTQNVSPSLVGSDTWSINLSGFTDGAWAWWVVAKDAAGRGGNTATADPVHFTVDTGGGGGTDTITNAHWSAGGTVQTAAGRIYFEMPTNASRATWTGYVCSGTVVTDATDARSVILTAAHCVYDDANKAFARNVLFIPDQDGTGGAGTDLDCSNDPLGCWAPSFGVVDVEWTQTTFPDNIPWDYAFYVVSDAGAHLGSSASSSALDLAAGNLAVSFTVPYTDDGEPGATSIDFTHALGYSYSEDPNFMYCAEDMTTEGAYNWWLSSCGLSGGASGGPWMQPVDGGNGPVISVNSWGYTTAPGMAGPKLAGTSAECVFTMAKTTDFSAVPSTDGDAGIAQTCP